jgi:amino acid adenylation domain-containing protein
MHDLKKRLLNLTPEQQEIVRKKLSAKLAKKNGQTSLSQDVAIIGMSGRFPGARDVAEFWHNLANGVDCIQEVPPDRWDIAPYFDPNPGSPHKTYSKWGGFLADIDQFDPLFFNISPREAELMDPQQRLFLQEAWKALEDAGYSPKTLSGRGCGVFVGVWQSDYGLTTSELTAQGMNGNSCSVLASRIAYFLDLTGPCIAVDTACSSSLSAIHLGCQSLINSECELVLAGGVHVMTTPRLLVATGQMGILSPTGQCRTFDASADGWVMSEGVGVVVLKLLSQAIEDRDHIYGIIKSSGFNQNGKGYGLAAPKALAQAQLQKKVYEKGGINPETIDYVEVQGISDKLADAIEFEALKDSFSAFTSRRNFCALGSLKPNIGHPLTASGIACLIKVLLSFKYKQLPPTIHLEKVNEAFELEQTPFYINTKLQEWQAREGHPRRAAINGFGLSGTNCHLVLEEYKPEPENGSQRAADSDLHLIVLSAKTEERLKEVAQNLHRRLSQQPIYLPSLAYTLQTGREAMDNRLAFIVQDQAELLQSLAAYLQDTGNQASPVQFFRSNPAQAKEAAGILATGRVGRDIIHRSMAEKDWEKLAFFWTQGADIPWDQLYGSDRPWRVPLPTYPFEPKRYWLETGNLPGRGMVSMAEEVTFGLDTTRTDPENIQAYLVKILSQLIKIPVTNIEPTKDFYDYGVDSLVGLQLRRRLEEKFRVKLTGRELIDYSTVQALADHLAKKTDSLSPVQNPVGQETQEAKAEPSIRMPLSEGQKGLWLLQTLKPEMSAYNVPVALRVQQRPDPQLWRKACDLLLAQYPILKTVIQVEEGQPAQVIDKTQALFFEVEDIGQLQQTEVIPYLKAKTRQPFQLETGPLLRVHLFTRSETEYILLVTIHHIILDGTSLVALVKALLQTYQALVQGQEPALLAAEATYDDFVKWEQALLAGEEGRHYLAYWQQQLAGELPLLSLPLDQPRPPVQQFNGEIYQANLEPVLTQKVRELAQNSRVNLATLFLGVFKALLYRYSGQADILIGVPTVGRPERRFEETLGYFINMAVIRSQINSQESGLAYLKKLQLIVVDALDHGVYPFPRLVSALKVNRDMATTPLFQVAFAFQNFFQATAFENYCQEILPCEFIDEIHQAGEFDLELEIVEAEDHYRLTMKYNPDLFHHSTIARMMNHYTKLVAEIVAAPEKAIGDYELLLDDEKQKILVEWNNTTANYPREKCVQDLFEAQANRYPENIALIFEDKRLTYRELSERSTQMALYLRAQGVGPDSLVGICLERSPEMVVGLLAILKAGGAYVPIEPDYPEARIAYMLADSGVKYLLTQEKFRDKFTSLLPADTGQVILLDRNQPEIVAQKDPLASRVQANHLAYVIYTSGSTGQPKGVMIEHRALTNFLVSMTHILGFKGGQRLLAVTTYCFDISILELFLPLINGGETVILSGEITRNGELLRKAIHHYRPTLMQATPSTWWMLFENSWKNEEQLTILCGGEALSESLRQKFKETPSQVWNMFGPTETTIWSTVKRLNDDEPITIGRPIHNTQIYILDRRRQPVPIGVAGDLYIAGDGLARGYLNRPGLTAEKFIPNPFNPNDESNSSFLIHHSSFLYKTGDLARWLADGTIEFLGRVDHQVKIRGYRIELAEIEHTLRQVEDIREAVVLDRTAKDGHKYLYAYYIAAREKVGLELRDFLARSLPAYMLPAHFVRVETIPLNSSGKIDRAALEALDVSLASSQAPAEPTTMLEQTIATIWQEVLDLKKVGVDDRFFEIGGNSLLIVKVLAQLKKVLSTELNGVALELTTLFKYPTIRELSYHLSTIMNCRQTSLNGGRSIPTQVIAEPGSNFEPDADIELIEPGLPAYYENSVAIIGLSCHFPEAKDYREFWSNLIQGRESIHFFSPEELAQLNLPEAHQPNYIGCKAGIEGKDLFDAAFFQISPHNAALMDPQARLLLEHCWATLEDAGYTPSQIPETGVFMTCSNNFSPDTSQTTDPSEQYVAWMMRQAGTLPTTISYRLGFSGPSIFVHSNCSSSLTALQVACQNLALKECKLALVGACSLNSTSGYIYHPDMNFSSDGHCKAFDASADGMVMGEGVGVVLLKPLLDAIRDGDHIYALLRGVGVNNDSANKVGYYAPGVQGQADLIQKTLKVSGVEPETIGYIEAHGTGTKLGDPIEVAALSEAYRWYTTKTQFCGLGSVKTNIGHLDTAAGLAGLTKAALCLYHRQIPPSLNFSQPNPKIDFEASPFYVVTRPLTWEAKGHPRRAAVSSLGVGGTNAHAILEEYVPEIQAEKDFNGGKAVIIPLSAKNSDRLMAYSQKLLAFLQASRESQINLAEMAYTLQVGRVAMEHRLVFVVAAMPDLIEKLEAFCAGETAIAGCYQGQVEQDKETLQAFSADEDGKELIDKWLAKGKVYKLAELWAKGLTLNWNLLYRARKPRRLSLPTYPFAGERYELPKAKEDSKTWLADHQGFYARQGNHPDEQRGGLSVLEKDKPVIVQSELSPQSLQPETKVANQRDRIKEIIKRKLADSLYVEAAEIDENKRFVDLGLDSILGVQLINALNSTLAINIQVTKIYEHSSVNELVDYITPLVKEINSNAFQTTEIFETFAVPETSRVSPDEQPQVESRDNLYFYPSKKEGELSDEKGVFEEFHLEGERNVCLRDHLIYGESLLPLDAYFEMIYGGIKRLFNRSAFSLSHVHLANPLVARAGETVRVQLNYRRTRQTLHFRAASVPASAQPDFRLNIKGDVHEIAPLSVKNEAYKRYLADHDYAFSQADFYHGQSSVGRPGPFYQTITELKTKGQVAVSQLTLSPAARQLRQEFLLNPAIVNGFLVTALNFAWQVNETEAGVFLPVLIDQVLIYGPLTGETYVSIVEVRETSEDWIKFDADLIDSADHVAMSFKGLQVKNIKDHEFRASLDLVNLPGAKNPSIAAEPHVSERLASSLAVKTNPLLLPSPAEDKIAVIGMSGKFPGANNLEAFWMNLAGGVDSITEIPQSRWDLEQTYAPGEPLPNKTYHKWGGFLEDVDRFDPTFFNISPLEAEQMDPQQRLFLETCWAALEDAGYAPPTLANVKCGVFVGATMSDYSVLLHQVGLDNTAQAFLGSSSAILTSRISYLLNLKGPAMAIDTACSSSLVAIHQACQSLRQGESEMALAGGVSLIFTPQYHIKGSHTHLLSPTGRCRPFDQEADGISWGEGVGVVVLKPYTAALRDKDPIYGIILASGVNQDGRTNGITAPNEKSQKELEITVYEQARIDPATIGYVEAHGTGTKLGDPVEVNALTEAFRQYTAKKGYCALGSVKGNIGHTTMAAGVAGLIKVLLSFKHRQIPPSINFRTPNEYINFATSPFYVNTTLQDWQPIGAAPRRAALSSFGFGGTNCHIVLEEAPAKSAPHSGNRNGKWNDEKKERQSYLFVLSARNEARLREYAQKMLDFLEENFREPEAGKLFWQKELIGLVSEIIKVSPEDIEVEQVFDEYGLDQVQLSRLREVIAERYTREIPPTILMAEASVSTLAGYLARNLTDTLPEIRPVSAHQDSTGVSLAEIAYTLQVGREAMENRLAIVVKSSADLCHKLNLYLENKKDVKVQGIYQGQVKGRKDGPPKKEARQMGDLTQLAQQWVEGVEIDWRSLYGTEAPHRVHLPAYPFARERYWIPELETSSSFNHNGPQKPKILHPLLHRKQITADLAEQRFISVFTGEEFFLRDHQVQGQRMLPGVAYLEMARAAADLAFRDKKVTHIKDVVWIRPLTVKNGPVEAHLSLHPEAANEAAYQVSTLDDRGQPVVCAQGRLAYAASPNLLGTGQVIDLAAIRQRCPKKKTKETCYQLFRQQGLDYGPGFQVIEEVVSNQEEVLARLQLQAGTKAEANAYGLHPSLMDGALQSVVGLIDAKGAATTPLYLPFAAQEIEILRPFTETSYVYIKLLEVHQGITHLNLTILDEQGQVCLKIQDFAVKVLAQGKSLPWPEQEFYYRPYWQRQALSTPSGGLKRENGHILLVVPQELPHISDRIAGAYPYQRVLRCILGQRNARLSETEWVINLADAEGLGSILASLPKIDTLYFLGSLAAVGFDLADLTALDRSQENGVIALFRLLKVLDGQGLLHQISALKVITDRACQILAQDKLQPWSASVGGLVMSLAKEYPALDVSYIDIALKTDQEGQVFMDERDVAGLIAESGSQGEPVALRMGVRYVRRLAHLTLPASEELPCRQRGVYLILGGAGGIGLETGVHLARQIQARLVLVGRSALTGEKEAQLNRIREAGGDYLYCQADGTDLEAMQGVVRQAKAKFGAIHGVIHSALVLKDAALNTMDEATLRAALAPKIKASVVLYQVVKDEPLDFMLFFSSVLSFWGNAGQSNYSAGCTFKDAFALSLTQTCPFPVKIINWGYWGYVGAVASESYRRRLSRQGIHSIAVEEGMAALSRILAGPVEQVAMLKVEPQALKELGIEFERRVEVLASRSRPMLNGLLERMKVEVEGLLA